MSGGAPAAKIGALAAKSPGNGFWREGLGKKNEDYVCCLFVLVVCLFGFGCWFGNR